MYWSRNKGFTLIEVTLVLAISALLAVMLLGTYQSQTRRARFTDAMERIAAELGQLKTETNSAFTTGTGTDESTIFFGKEIVFTQNSGIINVNNLTADRNDGGTLTGISAAAERNYEAPWGVVLLQNGGNNKLIFTRNTADGLLKTYVLPNAGANSNSLDPASYNTTTGSIEAVLLFESPEGHRARIRVNPATSEIRIVYVN